MKQRTDKTIIPEGKALKGSYFTQEYNPETQPHPAIIFVTFYLVERGLIWEVVWTVWERVKKLTGNKVLLRVSFSSKNVGWLNAPREGGIGMDA